MSVILSVFSIVWKASSVWSLLALTLLSAWAYYRYRIKYRRQIEYGNKIPGPFSLPLIGNAHLAIWVRTHSDVFKTFWDGSKPFRHLGIGRMWLGPRLLVGIWNPEDIETILSSNVHLKKPSEYDYFKPWFGNGLLISSGELWKTHRKLIAPTFHLSVLETFISLFNENSRATVERMRKKVGGKIFDAHDYMVEIIVEILMGCVDIIHNRHLRLWLRSDFIFSLTKAHKVQEKMLNIIHGLTKKVIREKREENKSVLKRLEVPADQNDAENVTNNETFLSNSAMITDDLDDDLGEKKRKPFLDQLVDISQDGVVLTDTEIKELVDTIMFEGHDTTAAAASFFVCIMGNHPEYQERCVEELREIFGDSDRPATIQDTLEMKYLERCILETVRMFPPVPIIGRTLEEDCKTASGYILPAGATVGVLTYGVHHWDKVYPNHEVFDPDNFLPERISERHPYAFVPFSAGPRSCVGRKYAMLKLKILLSTVLRNYKIVSHIPEEKIVLQADIILKRADGFKVQIEPRKV